MLSGVLLLLSAQAAAGPAATYGPAPAAKPKLPATPRPSEPCRTSIPTDPGEIIVCAQRPQGYRIDPDVLEAARQKKRNRSKPAPPDRMTDKSCQVVGPMGCRGGPAINVVQVAMTAAKMADRVSKGQEIGSMFKTTPEPSEYDLYLAAKREREEKEEQAAAAAFAKAAQSPAAK